MNIIDRKFLDTPTASAHASSIVFYKDKLYSAWFGGSREGASDVCIYVNNGTVTKAIGGQMNLAHWNPIWFVDDSVSGDEDLYLFYKIGEFCDRWQTFIVGLDEDLNQLSHPQILPAGINGPVKTKPLKLGNNVFCGSSVETFADWTSYVERLTIKDKKLRFEERSRPMSVPKQVYEVNLGRKRLTNGILQPTLWYDHTKDQINMFLRSSRGLSQLYYASGSIDFGRFRIMPVLNIENPNSSVDVVYYNDRLFLACNPSDIDRSPLVIYELDTKNEVVYEDDTHKSTLGTTFAIKDTLTIGSYDDVEGCMTKELSYPYLIEHGGKLYLSYTYGRSKIEICTIEI